MVLLGINKRRSGFVFCLNSRHRRSDDYKEELKQTQILVVLTTGTLGKKTCYLKREFINSQKRRVDMDITRRQKLSFLASLSVCGLSGCALNIPDSNAGGNPTYDYPKDRPIYISENIHLQFPDDVKNVHSPDNADMIVLSPDTEKNAEQVVSWMRDQKGVSVFGDGDEVHGTWDVWRETDTYQEIEGEARAGSTRESADSKMFAAQWKSESIVASHTSTWDNLDGRDLIVSIDYAFQEMDEDGALPSDTTGN